MNLLLLSNFILFCLVDGRLHKLKLKVQEEMETLDRSLLLLLAQIPSDEANLPSSQFSNVCSQICY